jgi:NADH:ubiquinone oxidoreductase subunit F (NADH-binding)
MSATPAERWATCREAARERLGRERPDAHIRIQVGSATCEDAAGAGRAADEFEKHLRASGRRDVLVRRVGCTGRCSCEPIVGVHVQGAPPVLYERVDRERAHRIFTEHVLAGRVVTEYALDGQPVDEIPFFRRQTRIALRNSGVIDPESLDESIVARGFEALAQVLTEGDPAAVRRAIETSRLRGRGGGGYPTGLKWTQAAEAPGTEKYIICNADEGDPGAFMDRSMLEGDPFSVLEGMIIGAFAIGAHEGFVYIRAEYPLAVRRLERAIALCRAAGLLGSDVLGSGFDFDLDIRLGAGAFVCGEETALIHSIEGERGQPRIRPPFPTTAGLWGQPTCINNVETFANVPAILLSGPEWFRSVGTPASGGAKVFALAGKVAHTGLVEVPMGTTLREIVFDIAGGVRGGKRLKAIQTGGPAGGCIPAEHLDMPVDFDTLAKLGSIMGSGGMIVLDEDDCVVDLARYFMAFTEDESCGKCTPCREGTHRLRELLERMTGGQGVPEDLPKLERLARLVSNSSLCGLGRAAPNPVLSTLRSFRAEYEAHVGLDGPRTCPARRCRALVRYEITPACVGCTLCAKRCPVACIAGERRGLHTIDQSRCIRCGACFDVCRFAAVSLA